MKRILILTCMLGLASATVAQQVPQEDKAVVSFSLNKKQLEGIKTGLDIATQGALALYLLASPVMSASEIIYKSCTEDEGFQDLTTELLKIWKYNSYDEERSAIGNGALRIAFGSYMAWKTYKSIRKALPSKKAGQK